MKRLLAALGLRAEMFGGVGRALSSPLYRLYACGHIANVFGWWCNRLGIGWLTWELTGSAAWLGIVAFAGMIPVLSRRSPASSPTATATGRSASSPASSAA